MDEDQGEVKISKYNSEMAQINRIDGLWRDANNHSRLGLYSKWNKDLDCIWSELIENLEDSDYKIKEKEFKEIEINLGKLGSFKDNADEGFTAPTEEDLKTRSKHYTGLRKKELVIRRLQKFVGKGSSTKPQTDSGNID